ncbi:MAG: PorV/PorQ family protein [Candidatus Zixiibacteriota bacterium]
MALPEPRNFGFQSVPAVQRWMGGAVIANTYGIESMYWNPAGLASLEGTEAAFTHLPYFADIDVDFGGIATHIEGFGTLGLGAKVISIGNIEETTDAFPDGTGRFFDPTMAVIGLTYSKVLTSNVSFGVTGNLIHERIFEVSATGVAFDVGFLYEPKWRGVHMGLTLKNYGPEMEFSGRGFERKLNDDHKASPNSATFDLPSSINLGLAYDFVTEGLNVATLSGNFRSNNFSEDLWQSGVEYVYDQKYFIRGGYNFSSQDNYMYGMSFGAGLIVPLGESKIGFEYSWTETEFFTNNQYFTVKFNF